MIPKMPVPDLIPGCEAVFGQDHAQTMKMPGARPGIIAQYRVRRAYRCCTGCCGGSGAFEACAGGGARQHHDAGADLHAAVEILDILVGQPDAARRDVFADRRGLVGAVDAVERLAEIERARAERIAFAARHEARQIGLALDHFRRRMPVRPLGHFRDAFRARPGEAFAADADAVAHRLPVAEHEIEIRVGGIDHERAGRLGASGTSRAGA